MLVIQAPELPKSIEELVLKSIEPIDEVLGVSRSWWDERSKYLNTRRHDIPKEVIIVDPAKFFCNESNCFAARSGIAYYFDNNHMSVAGARLVAKEITKNIGNVSKQYK